LILALFKKVNYNFFLLNRANRNAKHQLEHDWSNKFEAKRADDKAHSRKNTDVDIMFYPGAARYQETYV
jgi:hypothetical protein